MNCIVLLPLFVLAVAANGFGSHSAPASNSPVAFSAKPVGEIVRLHHEIKQDQINSVSFDTSNGIKVVDETKVLPGTPNPENPSELWNKISKSGSYSYTSPEGVPISIQWTADGVNGFRATGDAIPTAPALPVADVPAPAAHASPSAYRY